MTDTPDTDADAAAISQAARTAPPAKPETPPTSGKGKIWMGTAVGVGSAALVAALMYAKRRK